LSTVLLLLLLLLGLGVLGRGLMLSLLLVLFLRRALSSLTVAWAFYFFKKTTSFALCMQCTFD